MQVTKEVFVDVEKDGEAETIQMTVELDIYPSTFQGQAEIVELGRDARWVDSTPYGTVLTDAEYTQYEKEIEAALDD